MAQVANIYFRVDLDTGSEHIATGQGEKAGIALNIGGDEYSRQQYTIETTTSQLIFDGPNAIPFSDFELIAITSDQDLEIELVVDDDGTVGKVVNNFSIKQNIPFILSSNVARAIAGGVLGENFADGTADTIDEIRLKNNQATDATVEVLIAT